ncbi:MAG: glycoside hydrolase family 26 protein [Acidimicrobiales bacterium]
MRLIGLHLDHVPFDGLGPIVAAEAAIGAVDIVHWFQAWGGGHAPFHAHWLDTVAGGGRRGLITWEPWAPGGPAHQLRYGPQTIVDGVHDDYIRSWAEGLARRDDGPWYLRPMHEMNGTWYPWAAGVKGNDPALVRAAWRHLHHVFTDAGATGVAWVWSPLADDVAGPFENCYPGSDVVDVLALDGYNWGSGVPTYGGWRSPSELFGSALTRLCRLGPQPLWLAEVGSAPAGGDKAAWVDALLTVEGLPAEAGERLEAVVFFGLDKEQDWRVHTDPAVAAAVRRRGRR